MSALLMPESLPTNPHWELRRATSSDRRNWTADPEVYGIHLSSLSLFPVEEGWILLVSVDAMAAAPLGVQGTPSRTVAVIASKDLKHWSSHWYRLMDDTESLLTDPSWWMDGEGLHGLWYRMPWDPENPGVPEGEHPLATAVWKGGCFEEQQVVYTDENLLDPVMCPHPARGDWWLFATSTNLHVRGASGSTPDSFSTAFTTDQGSVPYCFADGEDLRVISQTPDGLFPVLSGHVTVAGLYKEDGPLYEESPFPNCTAPVMAERDGVWSLFCSVWVEGG